jgi:hypothetical protein
MQVLVKIEELSFCGSHAFGYECCHLLGYVDRPCDLVVRVPGCKHRGHGFDSWRHLIYLSGGGSGTGSTQPHEDK